MPLIVSMVNCKNHCVRTATMCVLGARPRSSCGAIGDLTALLCRPYGVPTVRIPERVLTARTLCMLCNSTHALRAGTMRCGDAPLRAVLRRTRTYTRHARICT
jgi:hypothetical protein